MNNKFKTVGVIALSVVAAFVVIFFSIKSIENKAIGYEETIATSKASISKEEKRRIDLFGNLVDAIESYNDYESSTMNKIVEARNQTEKGNLDNAAKELNVVVEQYPELKSLDNYKKAMTEFSVTENRLADYRENYNVQVRKYNKYLRSFPSKQLLQMQGYEKRNYEYLEFEVDNAEATNLFGK